jgi:hypothetical protein
VCIHNVTHFIFFSIDIVDDKPLGVIWVKPFVIQRAENINLVIFHRIIGASALINVDYVVGIINPESAKQQ